MLNFKIVNRCVFSQLGVCNVNIKKIKDTDKNGYLIKGMHNRYNICKRSKSERRLKTIENEKLNKYLNEKIKAKRQKICQLQETQNKSTLVSLKQIHFFIYKLDSFFIDYGQF